MAGPGKFSYSHLLGKNASWRLQKWVFPDSVWNQEVYGQLVNQLLQANPAARWLDAGCGSRVLAQGLESLEDSAVAGAGLVVGLDPYLPSLACHRNVRVRVCGFIDHLPFPDGAFDLVTCNMVVEHLADPQKCFAEIRRVLRPGGRVIFHTPNLLHYMVFLNHTIGRVLPRKLVLSLIQASDRRGSEEVFPTFYRMNSPGKVKSVADATGLAVNKIEFIPPPRPFFNFFLPAAFVQLMISWLMAKLGLEQFESTLLVTLRKPE